MLWLWIEQSEKCVHLLRYDLLMWIKQLLWSVNAAGDANQFLCFSGLVSGSDGLANLDCFSAIISFCSIIIRLRIIGMICYKCRTACMSVPRPFYSAAPRLLALGWTVLVLLLHFDKYWLLRCSRSTHHQRSILSPWDLLQKKMGL